MVLADEEAIRQIVDNLIDNAIKYTPDGGSVSVICHGDQNSASIEVADSGIGIPRADLPRIFERFYRVDKARSRELGGTGLGLSIVKHLIQSIGGQIDVTSRVGSGSRFTIHLPRCLVPRRSKATRPHALDNSGDRPESWPIDTKPFTKSSVWSLHSWGDLEGDIWRQPYRS